LRLHEQNPEASYLNPQQLFAIVDLDLQNKRLDDSYPFKDLEKIFEDLYEKSLIKVNRVGQHRIWVTGLIHKESYLFSQYYNQFLANIRLFIKIPLLG
jgi:hypothetical protein